MDDPLLVLVHSPLTGPGAWEPTAEALRSLGHVVALPDLGPAFAGEGPYHPAAAAQAAAGLREYAAHDTAVLIAHSGGGALVPAIAEAVPRTAAAVFVDALLPHPGTSWFASAPAEVGGHLRDTAVDGVLPKWSDWFPAEAIADLLPDPEQREAFVAALPRLPLAYFEENAPAAPDWPPGPCAYVRLSEAYRSQAAEAVRLGWAVTELPSDHLAITTQPEKTARILSALVRELA
ncbi:alpha/beta fold hydrolase [Glycomyces terrestris]|uniref:Alpha/beta hydrolase n=1 Tax=Glycomyces terrestris TaxID=2493553 RepID=A0A426V4C2_9ACTN|nr:alpha/beta hydrolase [Glycomyces terrestris]RRS01685.1 alpha/beta hydrolase [Glycomyces terrestris]